MPFGSLITLLLATVAAAAISKGKVTPIEKVTELLHGLQDKVTEEGKREAAAYDKYACFCKEQVIEKQHAVETSTKKIEKLEAQVESETAEKSGLDEEVAELDTKISAEETEIKDDAEEFQEQHAKYLANAKDLATAIDACKGAIDALSDAKGDLTDAKLNLVQVHQQLLATASRHAVPSETLGLIEELGRARQDPAKYQFQSGNIMDGLLEKFRGMKEELDANENERQAMFDRKSLGDKRQVQFDGKEKTEKASLSAETTEALMTDTQALDEEKKDKAADDAFFKGAHN